jgi:hypothetical protein
MWWRALPVLLMLLASGASRAQEGCARDTDVDYVCGVQKPEDVLAIPQTRWLIASGFAPGAGLTLVDTRTRRVTRWYLGTRSQVAPDRRHFPHCPDALDAALFNARGIALLPRGRNRWQLLVANHGGRQSIETFDVRLHRGTPTLRWRGCIPMPPGQVGNSVTGFADGTVLATVLTRPGTTIADFVSGLSTGGVWRWRPGDAGFALLPGTDLPGNNGLEIDPDQRRFYVVAFGWHAVVVFDRADTRSPLARIDAPDFMPDNIHWTDGRLLLAGMRLDEPACGGLRPIVDGVADPMLCHRGWVVGELKDGRIATVAYGRPQPGWNGLSSAAIIDHQLWLGSFQANRLAIVRGWRAFAPAPLKELRP